MGAVMMSEALFIRAENLGKDYRSKSVSKKKSDAVSLTSGKKAGGDVPALSDVSFEIVEGERVGVIGVNGAGKSTLLKLIAGTAEKTSGKLTINGNVHAALTLGIGTNENATGRENFYIDAEMHGKQRSDIDGIIEEMIAFVDLGEFIDKPVHTYSSGMKSRLNFTSLVFVEPEILLLDETLSTGDQWFQKKASEALHKLCAKGKIVIIVSHGMGAVQEMCNRCIWLKDGKVHADGDSLEVTGKYNEDQSRRVDEELRSTFNNQEQTWSGREGCTIQAINFHTYGHGDAGKVLFTGESSQIEICLELEHALQDPEIRLKIERVDGLQILDSKFEGAQSLKLNKGTSSVTASFEELHIGPGLLKCEAELMERGEIIALRTVVFKTHSEVLYTGGRPVLHYPVHVEVEPVGA
jgi:lipopolysaccharide transport system ATP-binding protein